MKSTMNASTETQRRQMLHLWLSRHGLERHTDILVNLGVGMEQLHLINQQDKQSLLSVMGQQDFAALMAAIQQSNSVKSINTNRKPDKPHVQVKTTPKSIANSVMQMHQHPYSYQSTSYYGAQSMSQPMTQEVYFNHI